MYLVVTVCQDSRAMISLNLKTFGTYIYIIYYVTLLVKKCAFFSDLWNFCSMLLIKMLNDYELHKTEILHIFHTKIFEHWNMCLRPEVLRALCILLINDISIGKSKEFYNRCCRAKVYEAYQVSISTIRASTLFMLVVIRAGFYLHCDWLL